MARLKMLTLSVLALLLVGHHADASVRNSIKISDSLKGTYWKGHFGPRVFGGTIEIQFYPELDADGNLQYIHKVTGGGVAGYAIGHDDVACPTGVPRTLEIAPVASKSGFPGKIRTFNCDTNVLEHTIDVETVELSDDLKTNLKIVALFGPEKVTYQLTRVSGKTASSADENVISRNVAGVGISVEEQQGITALKEVGFNPLTFDRQSLREAGILRIYQRSWNDFDPSVTDPLKIANPDKITNHYTDASKILYRDMCQPVGITNKTDLKTYLTVLYKHFPKQVWGDDWKKIRLYKGAAPGEWAYSYDFAMYKSGAVGEKPAFAGTGMERVKFDTAGKLISDEVHLISNSGPGNCEAGLQ